MDSAFQNCVCTTDVFRYSDTDSGASANALWLMPIIHRCSTLLRISCPSSSRGLQLSLIHEHAEGHDFSRPYGHTRSSHCSPHLPIPCTLLTQIAPNYLADLWPSGRLLEPAPSLQSLMDSLVNSFTVTISIFSSLCLSHFLYKYSLWKTNLSRCSLDKACSWSLCFTVHSIASRFLLFVGKKEKSFIAHVQLVLWGKPVGVGAKEV